MRLTETSVTEAGHVTGVGFKLHTRGYGASYIFPVGIGVAYTSLHTYGSGPSDLGPTSAHLEHDYADVTYTAGDRWLVTGGAGYLTHGVAHLASTNASADAGSGHGESLFLGPGVALGWFEAYWIYRRSWVGYALTGGERTLVSQLYQLGLGAHWQL